MDNQLNIVEAVPAHLARFIAVYEDRCDGDYELRAVVLHDSANVHPPYAYDMADAVADVIGWQSALLMYTDDQTPPGVYCPHYTPDGSGVCPND